MPHDLVQVAARPPNISDPSAATAGFHKIGIDRIREPSANFSRARQGILPGTPSGRPCALAKNPARAGKISVIISVVQQRANVR
jgi:hypothetical protein